MVHANSNETVYQNNLRANQNGIMSIFLLGIPHTNINIFLVYFLARFLNSFELRGISDTFIIERLSLKSHRDSIFFFERSVLYVKKETDDLNEDESS